MFYENKVRQHHSYGAKTESMSNCVDIFMGVKVLFLCKNQFSHLTMILAEEGPPTKLELSDFQAI